MVCFSYCLLLVVISGFLSCFSFVLGMILKEKVSFFLSIVVLFGFVVESLIIDGFWEKYFNNWILCDYEFFEEFWYFNVFLVIFM